MAKKTSKARTSPPPLRQQAEARWKSEHSAGGKRSGNDYQATIFELEVHQIELELQNEELRTAQLELARARDNYLDLYDFAPVGYVTLDARRIIRQANLTAATLLGVARVKLLGTRMERFISKDSRDAFYLHLQAAREALSGRTCDVALRHAGGREFVARFESAAIAPASADGGYRVAFTDVSALHDAAKALELSERRFRALTEKASDYITVVDAAGTITYENPTAHRTLGFAAGDLVGRSGFDLVHPDDLPRAQRLFQELARRPENVAEAEIRARARDGSWRWLRILGTNLLDDPAVRGIVLNSRDVTEQREAVDELRRSNADLDHRVAERTEAIERLQEHLLKIADQTQQRIAQDLHDDVGQELTGLSLKIETLVEALGGDAQCGKLAADVLANAERAKDKVRSLARQILPIEIELNSLPGALERLAAETARGRSASCKFHGTHSAATFQGRVAAQLYRIAQEAVSNAVRHSRARNIRIDLTEDGGRTRLCVSDDGRGMPANGRAAGLGIRIMHYRAGLLGGTLEIGRAAGGGTAVTCLLPGRGAGASDQSQ